MFMQTYLNNILDDWRFPRARYDKEGGASTRKLWKSECNTLRRWFRRVGDRRDRKLRLGKLRLLQQSLKRRHRSCHMGQKVYTQEEEQMTTSMHEGLQERTNG